MLIAKRCLCYITALHIFTFNMEFTVWGTAAKSLLHKIKVRQNNLLRTNSAPINCHLNLVVWSPTLFGLGRNGCWTSLGSQLPRALPFIFLLCCPLNDRSRAAHSFLFFFSCLSLALLCLLILLLLMSGNIHPNPGPIFLCSVCAGNVTWRGKSVQCCTCFK